MISYKRNTKKKIPIYFSIPAAWIIGTWINSADRVFTMCRGLHSIWGVIEKPHCLRFKALLHGTVSGFFHLGWVSGGRNWRQIGYQSQGWYKDHLWKSIVRQHYVGLSYLFLHRSSRGPSSARASVQSPTHKASSAPTARREILFLSSLFPAYQVIIVTLRKRDTRFLENNRVCFVISVASNVFVQTLEKHQVFLWNSRARLDNSNKPWKV